MSKLYVLVNQLKLTWLNIYIYIYVTKWRTFHKNKHYISYKATNSSVGLFFSVCECVSRLGLSRNRWKNLVRGNVSFSFVCCCLQSFRAAAFWKNSDFVKPLVYKTNLPWQPSTFLLVSWVATSLFKLRRGLNLDVATGLLKSFWQCLQRSNFSFRFKEKTKNQFPIK